ncbi:MAG: hypothetical protein R6V32_11350 [Bacteroidales bacterium]
MIKKHLLFAIICLFTSATIFAQDAAETEQEELHFTQVKSLGQEKTVYFHIDGIKDDDHKNAILEKLLKDPSITDGRIFKTPNQVDRCQLYVGQDIDAAYVRNLLKEAGVDYKFTTVSRNGHLEEQARDQEEKPGQTPKSPVNIEGFPEYKHTGNPEADEADYKKRKKEWIEANPEKYQQYLDNMKQDQ